MKVRRKAGLTILEVVLAIVILGLVMVPVLQTFSTFRKGFTKMNKYNIAIGLASTVLDHIHFSLYNNDVRLSDVLASQAEKAAAKADGAKDFFDEFVEDKTKVTSEDPSAISSYFVRINDLTKSGAFGITKENDPELYHQLKDFRCSVDVFYSLPYDIIDSDMDGTPEVDMAEVRVTISWNEDDRERSVELWTVYSARQYIEETL